MRAIQAIMIVCEFCVDELDQREASMKKMVSSVHILKFRGLAGQRVASAMVLSKLILA